MPRGAKLASDPPQGRPVTRCPSRSRRPLRLDSRSSFACRGDAYIERLETYVMGFNVASERGTRHDHIRQGLRTTGFERRLTVAFEITADQVTILGFFSGGRDWTATLRDDG